MTASCASSSPTAADSCNGKMATGAGIGVGATVGVAAVLALGIGLLLRERRRAEKRDLAKQMEGDTGQSIETTAPGLLGNQMQMAKGSRVGELSSKRSVKVPAAELGGGEVEQAWPPKTTRDTPV
ncbi:MAG: hypothetical protein M1835_004298 [Candelina submexicana]|nr:MAG: hypothetical protein M1835_004298 [Candelina submexicana]